MLRKIWAIMKLLALFNKELILSGITVLVEVLRPQIKVRPGIFKMDTELKTDFEITLLACLICLTPGTLTLDVSRDGGSLFIHAMNINESDDLAEQIKNSFEKAILEVTR
ncbi:Na+/H+ antiporter subunit E [Paenibacillus sp. CAU 1782]